MEIKKIGNRGTLFTFFDLGMPTNVYVINGSQKVYIIDTYLGPDSMKEIQTYIDREYGNKQLIIVNTHNHWDHVWGNCFFSSEPIIAHKLCKDLMINYGKEALDEQKDYVRGNELWNILI